MTLKRELKIKISDILGKYLKDTPLPEQHAIALVDELADLIIETKKPKIDLSKSDPAWNILFGENVFPDVAIEAKEARDAFEVAFDKMSPPWYSNKDWKDFADWVAKVYIEDKRGRTKPGNCFSDYTLWRSEGGKYGHAMSNLAIRKNPKQFMDTAWSTFLAHSSMYPSKRVELNQPADSDDNGIPISY